jgi:hypothetical protein
MPATLSSSDDDKGLQSAVRGLHATPATPLPFLKGVVVRSFVLEREPGNIIVYHSPGLTAAASAIQELGRPDRLLVNHWHEAMYDAPYLDVPIFVHEDDRAQTKLPITGTFSSRQRIADDLEVIPTPGHTAGTTTFLWENGEHRFLFPGDSIWVQGGEWKAVLLGESDRADYLASLERLLEVDFDFLMPWGSGQGQPYGFGVTREKAQQNLEEIIDRLRSGANA